jgi:hypothetical protein
LINYFIIMQYGLVTISIPAKIKMLTLLIIFVEGILGCIFLNF